jgi:diguanylate cyclase (GGDEF)-like protein
MASTLPAGCAADARNPIQEAHARAEDPAGRSREGTMAPTQHGAEQRAAVSINDLLAGTGPSGPPESEVVTALLDALPHAAFTVAVDDDGHFRFLHTNARYRSLLGLNARAQHEGDLRAVLPADALVSHVRQFAAAARGAKSVSFDARVAGGRQTIAVSITPILDADGRCRHLLGSAYDVSDRTVVERQLEYRTRHDALTELPNRIALLESLDMALERARANDRLVGLVLLDVDHFKVVNDSLGHDLGDRLLTVVAQRVQKVMRSGDMLARVGGDELAIVCNSARSAGDALALAARVQQVFDEPFRFDEREHHLSASVGVVLSEGADDAALRMLRDADVAKYVAKERGRGRVELFAEPMRARAVDRFDTEVALRRALARSEFRVHYQPLVQFDTSEVIGFEALVRWEHPERGLVPPLDFLPLAEETGLIVPIGAWVLREACAQAARWAVESSGQPALSVSVNLSARQLADPALVETIDSALRDAELDPSLLVLEITETVLMEDRERAVAVLRSLTDRGVQIGIDDFGTGHSSLGYLKTLPVHALKIDRSFVDGLGTEPEDSAIVAAVVHLGHALGLTVTAEGIETPVQLSELQALGCDLGQGYYFARPQPSEIVRALVHHRFPWRNAQ